MADILQITTTNAIRGLFGADGLAELTDDELIAIGLPFELQVDLNQWLEPLKSVSEIISEGNSSSATPQERTRYLILRLYGQYFCAHRVANSAEYTLLEVLNDGQSEARRTKRDLPAFLDRLSGLISKYKTDLIEDLGGTVSQTPNIFSGVSPSYDPVTNETV